MDTAGMVLVIIGIYLLTSAIKNRRPVELAQKVIKNPAAMKTIVQNAEGYQATSTGAPSLHIPLGSNPVGTGSSEEYSSDPTMALGTPALQGGDNRPPQVPAGVAAGVQPVARRALYSVARAFPTLKSFGGRGLRPIGTSDHPRGLAVDFMIPDWKTPAGNALGWRVAEYARTNASALGVKYIIWDAKKWNPAGGSGWRPYKHPLGASPTLAHKDHVHVSFKG